MMGDDYDVGYRKPPKSGRFKPGEVNNPHGRRGRNGSKTAEAGKNEMAGLFKSILSEKQDVTINGRKQRMTRHEVFCRKLLDDATAGRGNSRQNLLMLYREFRELFVPDIRPSGRIVFSMQTLKDVSLEQFLEFHPETPDKDLAVLRKYFGPERGHGVDFDPWSGDGKNHILPHLVPKR
jgi:hypothetical protein